MEIKKTQNGNELVLALIGRLDTNTAPQLEEELKQITDETTSLVFDFEKLEYVSSAGLRVLLAAQKVMSLRGEMTLINVCDDIKEIFEITGFSDILTVK